MLTVRVQVGRRVCFIQTISQVNLTKLGVGERKWNQVFPFQASKIGITQTIV